MANKTLNHLTVKNVNTSVPELKKLCNSHDFVFLQETWMSRAQLPTLSNINNKFVGYGLSSMKDEEQIHTGRPFDGVAVLWRKTLSKFCSIITYDCDRILGLQFTCGSFTALFLCVYLPYECSDNYDDYMFYLSKIFQMIDEFQSPYIFVCGDFNANIRGPSQFGDDLLQICSDNSLCLADELFLPRYTFTFISSSHDTVSWLDHILTTTSGYSLFTDICVKSDFITSDHLPLCFTISVDNLNLPISSSANNIPCDAFRYNWYGASDFDISNYYSCTRSELSKIKVPLDAMQCEDVRCIKHRRDIVDFYSAIPNCLHGCIKQCIPVLKLHNDNSVVGTR